MTSGATPHATFSGHSNGVSMRKDTNVDSEAAPYFGADNEELHLLRQLRKVCEAEEELPEDIVWVLEALKKVKKKKKN